MKKFVLILTLIQCLLLAHGCGSSSNNSNNSTSLCESQPEACADSMNEVAWAKTLPLSVSEYDPGGNPIWPKAVMAIDQENNLFSAQMFHGEVELDAISLASNNDKKALFWKMNPDGKVLWAKAFPQSQYLLPVGIATDHHGNVIVTGIFLNTINLGGNNLVNEPINPYAYSNLGFLAKFDQDGNHLWSHKLGDQARLVPRDLAIDSDGNVLVSGFFSGDFTHGDQTIVSDVDEMANQGFLLKYDSQGTPVWANKYDKIISQVYTDGENNVLLLDDYYGDLTGFGETIPGSNSGNVFLVKLNPEGQQKWVATIRGNGSERAKNLAVNSEGNIFLLSRLDSSEISYNSETVITDNQSELAIFNIDSDGKLQWAETLSLQNIPQPLSSDSEHTQIHLKGNGEMILTGLTNEAIDLENIGLQGDYEGGYYVYQIGLSADRKVQWASEIVLGVTPDSIGGATTFLELGEVTLDNSGNPITCGYYKSGAILMGEQNYPNGPGSRSMFVHKLESSN